MASLLFTVHPVHVEVRNAEGWLCLVQYSPLASSYPWMPTHFDDPVVRIFHAAVLLFVRKQ